MLAFGLTPYVNLSTSTKDTIKTISYLLDRSYTMNNSTQLLFAFPQEKKCDWIQFNMTDFGLGIGGLHFKFNTTDLDHIPHVNYNL
jgi:hypothetical protein